jgi:hypothetical protein
MRLMEICFPYEWNMTRLQPCAERMYLEKHNSERSASALADVNSSKAFKVENLVPEVSYLHK